MTTPAALAALSCLVEHELRFIVVGGVAAVLHGVPLYTGDVDVLYALDDENVDRAMRAVEAMDARFRERPDIAPARSHLASRGHKLLTTRFGHVDMLGFIGKDRDYDQLLAHSVRLQISDLEVDVLDLPMIIAIKEELGHPKDLASLPLLRATLQRRDQ